MYNGKKCYLHRIFRIDEHVRGDQFVIAIVQDVAMVTNLSMQGRAAGPRLGLAKHFLQ